MAVEEKPEIQKLEKIILKVIKNDSEYGCDKYSTRERHGCNLLQFFLRIIVINRQNYTTKAKMSIWLGEDHQKFNSTSTICKVTKIIISLLLLDYMTPVIQFKHTSATSRFQGIAQPAYGISCYAQKARERERERPIKVVRKSLPV